MSAVHPGTGQILRTVAITSEAGNTVCAGAAILAAAPGVPANFAAAVHGRRVTLSWDRPAQTTHYEVEAGSAPGWRDLARLTPDRAPLRGRRVPPGVYYVRVRALNDAGKGPYTADLRIVVQ
jgi:hypothetical protein